MTAPTPTPPCLGEREAVARTIFQAFYDDVRTEADFSDPRYASSRVASELAADAIDAEHIAPRDAENETLRAERDAARDTNRELHRRLQAVEGPMAARVERGEREAAFWLEARKEAGRRASHALFRANRAEAEAARLTAKLAQAEGEIATAKQALKLAEGPLVHLSKELHGSIVVAAALAAVRAALTTPEPPHGD